MQSLFSSDIQKLNTLYNRLQFSFVFLYGRFGTGKTSLVREFCQNKKTVFFSAREMVPQRQLHAFWKEAVNCLSPARSLMNSLIGMRPFHGYQTSPFPAVLFWY